MAEAILHLAADASRYVTSSELVIDGTTAGVPRARWEVHTRRAFQRPTGGPRRSPDGDVWTARTHGRGGLGPQIAFVPSLVT